MSNRRDFDCTTSPHRPRPGGPLRGADEPEHRKAGAAGRPAQCEALGRGRWGLSSLPAYFNQPRFLKYHIGTKALANISSSAIGYPQVFDNSGMNWKFMP